MLDGIAFSGILMSWLALCWLPFMILRAILGTGDVRKWSIIALCLTGLSVLGYTRAISGGEQPQAILWSLFWALPLGLTLFVWKTLDPPLARFDKWLVVGALFFFILALPGLPQNLHELSALIW